MEKTFKKAAASTFAAQAVAVEDCNSFNNDTFKISYSLPFDSSMWPDGDNLIIEMPSIIDPALTQIFSMIDRTSLTKIEKSQLIESMEEQIRSFAVSRFFTKKLNDQIADRP